MFVHISRNCSFSEALDFQGVLGGGGRVSVL
jgi:hypothetical protein